MRRWKHIPCCPFPAQSVALVGPSGTGSANVEYQFDANGTSVAPPSVSAGMWFYTDAPAGSGSVDDCMTIRGADQDFAAVNCYSVGGQQTIGLECAGGIGTSPSYVYAPGSGFSFKTRSTIVGAILKKYGTPRTGIPLQFIQIAVRYMRV